MSKCEICGFNMNSEEYAIQQGLCIKCIKKQNYDKEFSEDA